MANDLASAPAGSADPAKDLAALAVNSSNFNRAIKEGGTPESLRAYGDAAMAILRRNLTPLKDREPDGITRDDNADSGFRFNGLSGKLADALRPLGIKCAPHMSASQAGAWLAAVTAALSDLPAGVAVRACQDALHVTIGAPWEVEGVVRDKAEPLLARFRLACSRLEKAIKDEQARQKQRPALPPPPPMTQEDVDRLDAPMVRIGLASGYLRREGDRVVVAPPTHQRTATDGIPYFCVKCRASFSDFMKCDKRECQLESEEAAIARKDQ